MNDIIPIPPDSQLHSIPQRGIPDFVAEFLADSQIKDVSRKRYRNSLKSYFKWVEKNGIVLSNATRADLIKYQEYLIDQRKSVKTIGAYCVAIRQFYTWLESKYRIPNIANGLKSPKGGDGFIKQHLTEEECSKLLEHYRAKLIPGNKENILAHRDYALVNLLLRTGIRTIEASRIRLGDIKRVRDRWQVAIHGKGRVDKSDYVWLEEKAKEPIDAYLALRAVTGERAGEADPLFKTETSNAEWAKEQSADYVGGISTKTISTTIREGLDAIGLTGKEYTAHSLRHTFAVTLIKRGARLEDVQAALRHKNITTTQIYLLSIAEDERFEKRIEALISSAF